MLRFFILASIFVGSHAWAITPGQFWQEILDHRGRVKQEMLAVFEKHPERFSSLDEDTIAEYALLHDSAKAKPQFFSELIRFYGVKKTRMNPVDRARFEDVRQQINATEAVEKNKFFSTVSPEAESELLELEHIADTVDTGLFRVAEVGEVSLGSRFLRFVESAEPEIVEIAEDLEAVLMVVK